MLAGVLCSVAGYLVTDLHNETVSHYCSAGTLHQLCESHCTLHSLS